jgi:N-acetylmuramoyl-L-alanine amidase
MDDLDSTAAPDGATLVVIVGHDKTAPGATMAGGGNEYIFNTDIAARVREYGLKKYPTLKVIIILRDGIGIVGAYRLARTHNPDACLELHFNSFNGSAHGTETLCSVNMNDRVFAQTIQAKVCGAFDRPGLSRGVKVVSKNARGGASCYGLPGSANCLVEPFFGDNPKEALLARERRIPYAMALLDGTVDWMKSQGMRLV